MTLPINSQTSRGQYGTTSLAVIAGLILAAALFRMLPSPEYRPPNFAPIGAMALFGGAAIVNRRLAFGIPLLAMFISDLFIEFDSSRAWVYSAIVLVTLLGRLLQSHRRQISHVFMGSLAASLLFFLVTNFGVWLMSGYYSHTFSELLRCYTLAIPFFRNTVTGDLLFSTMLFGSLAWLESRAAATVPATPTDL